MPASADMTLVMDRRRATTRDCPYHAPEVPAMSRRLVVATHVGGASPRIRAAEAQHGAHGHGGEGPHVLELKDRLRLSPEQEARITALRDAMFAESRADRSAPGASAHASADARPADGRAAAPLPRGPLGEVSYPRPARSRAAPRRVLAPCSMSSIRVNSSSQWLRPSWDGTKIMPAGPMAAMYWASCPAPERMRR